jgi:hypothetical protein
MVSFTAPITLVPGKELPVPSGQEAGWAPYPVWAPWRGQNIPSFPLPKIELQNNRFISAVNERWIGTPQQSCASQQWKRTCSHVCQQLRFCFSQPCFVLHFYHGRGKLSAVSCKLLVGKRVSSCLRIMALKVSYLWGWNWSRSTYYFKLLLEWLSVAVWRAKLRGDPGSHFHIPVFFYLLPFWLRMLCAVISCFP